MPTTMIPTIRRVRPVAVTMLAAALVAGVVPAAEARVAGVPWMLAQASPAVSPDAAAERVRAESGGRILDVRLEHGAGGPVYRVKVLLDGGRVRVYRVDATSGQIIQ